MTSFSLIPHPGSPTLGIETLGATLERSQIGNLVIRYKLTGEVPKLKMPPTAAPIRTDGLWEHTCFELFIRPAEGSEGPYWEFNFSPSTAWAAYRFESCRTGRADAPLPPPQIETCVADNAVDVIITLDLSTLPGFPAHAPWQINLSAVLEAADGQKAYWALTHRAGPPDFHHPDCFAGHLQAPSIS